MEFKRVQLTLLMILALVAGMECPADTHYVSLSGTNNSPYLNWADAATDVTWAVTAAGANDTVLVTNGTYFPSNRMYATAAITLRSVSGRDATIINGANNTDLCAALSSASSVIDGFTVTNCNNTLVYGTIQIRNARNCIFVNNSSKGGIIWSYNNSQYDGSITNCIFKNNTGLLGGGIYASQGTVAHTSSITIAGCHFEGNRASTYYGGACDLRVGRNIVSNCMIINNRASEYGGGIFISSSSTNNLVVNCTITGNVCVGHISRGLGGGIYTGGKTTIRDCSIIGNVTTNRGGGVWGTNVTIQNCLVARNISLTNTGGGVWMTNGLIESCTIVSNQAAVAGGGVYVDGGLDSDGTNNIIYFNTAANGANFTNTSVNTGMNYSCVIPAVNGTGNITNNPLLLDLDGGNYHLRMNSPCVNAGTNQDWMNGAVDVDGVPRIRYGIVDMGAYETILRQGNIYRVR